MWRPREHGMVATGQVGISGWVEVGGGGEEESVKGGEERFGERIWT